MDSEGVLITYSELKAVDDSLKNIIEEMTNASQRSDTLEGAIGSPFGKSQLRSAAHEFEGGWNDRRKALLSDIEEVEQHVEGVLDSFTKWDHDTTTQKESPQ